MMEFSLAHNSIIGGYHRSMPWAQMVDDDLVGPLMVQSVVAAADRQRDASNQGSIISGT